MEHVDLPSLLDETGHPLSTHIDGALRSLVPKFRKRFPTVHDEFDVAEILEEAGRRISLRERRAGRIEKLHAYAWVTVRSVAASRLRRGSGRLTQRSIGSDEGHALMVAMPAPFGTPEQIEREIVLREALAHLTPDERMVCNLKKMGFSSATIARERGTSVDAVNMLFSRTKHKLRAVLNPYGTRPPGNGDDDSHE